MDTQFRQPTEADASTMAAVASRCQHDPGRHIAYLGLDADSIETDIRELPDWTTTSIVAEHDGAVVGFLVAEIDAEMGRLWWWGPFIDGSVTDADWWTAIADELYRRTRALVSPAITEEEACADDRSELVADWCARHELMAETASVLLRRTPGPATADGRVRPLAESDHAEVMALHDQAFPGTHTTAAALVQSADPRLVIDVPAEPGPGESDAGAASASETLSGTVTAVGGYVAYEVQSDGSGYIDYLAVDPARRGQGLGAVLVDTACRRLFDSGVSHAHLTVREDNVAARALYRRLGFKEDRLARPFRLGFALDEPAGA